MNTSSFKDFILDQLNSLSELRCQRMFGGYALYSQDLFFAILARERLYFKTNSETKADYVDKGMAPFKASAKQTLKNYYEVPVEVIEDSEELCSWAQKALLVASE